MTVVNDKGVRVPQVVWSHTTKRVLTLEDVRSIKISDYAAISAAGIAAARLHARGRHALVALRRVSRLAPQSRIGQVPVVVYGSGRATGAVATLAVLTGARRTGWSSNASVGLLSRCASMTTVWVESCGSERHGSAPRASRYATRSKILPAVRWATAPGLLSLRVPS